MDSDLPASAGDEKLAQAAPTQDVETAADLFEQIAPAAEVVARGENLARHAEVFNQASQLEARAKVALIRRLITHLKTDQIQALLEFGLREIGERHRRATASAAESRITSLLLKKDYTYQERGLSEPTQYYVYLRRRKPKLDRYIGTLFYIPQGCTLFYFPDAEGRILFNPPHNVFRLTDSQKTLAPQVVRLICLEPPPPEYSFTKQQDDVPEIYLRLEHLDPETYQPMGEESYAFPFCMYEGGKLDRYRWEVSPIVLSSETLKSAEEIVSKSPSKSSKARSTQSSPFETPADEPAAQPSTAASKDSAAKLPRRVIEIAAMTPAYYLANREDATAILERMRLWVTWSEKAMPQSKWDIVQDGSVYTLRNASFNRKILSFSLERASVTLENSLPVLVKWFQDLGLAVSQTQNQRQYSAAQLKLARSLFVDMSLPQDNPLVVLKKLFGVKFAKTSGAAKSSGGSVELSPD